MPNSSAPEPTPQLDLAELEEAEALEQRKERALGAQEAGERGGGWITAA